MNRAGLIALQYALQKTAAQQRAEDIVDTRSSGGLLADYLTPMTWGGERAGRSQAMADALAGLHQPSFNLRHPSSSTLLNLGGGAVTGGGLGGLIGGLGGALIPGGRGVMAGAGLGAVLGSTGGGLIGALNAARLRRKEMKRINKLYDREQAAGNLRPREPQLSELATLFLPFRGPHRTGQVEATRAMLTGTPISKQHRPSRDVLYALDIALQGAGIPFGLAHTYAQNFKTQFANPSKANDDDNESNEDIAPQRLSRNNRKAA